MKIVDTSKLNEYRLDSEQNMQVYCGLDNCLTFEIADVLRAKLEPETTGRTYDFSVGMQGPALAMMRRGWSISEEAVQRALDGDPEAKPDLDKFDTRLEAERDAKKRRLGLRARLVTLGGMGPNPKKSGPKNVVVNEGALIQRFAVAAGHGPINYNSGKQLAELLYEKLEVPPAKKRKGDRWVVTTDHDALEKLAEAYPRASLICKTILRIREIEKHIQVLETKIDEDNRIRTFYGVAGTETGRWSSKSNVFDTGTNLQNITPELRNIFVPDPGMVLVNVDLEQAESRAVAYLAQDEAYIHACESGDLHTTVAQMVFGVSDRAEADQVYYRHFSYRDMSKRAGHGTNYGLTPVSLARNMKISQAEAWKFYLMYLGGEVQAVKAYDYGISEFPHEREGRICFFPGAFPGIKKWHDSTRVELETTGELVTPLGRKRVFWGRLSDNATFREAVAFRPQSLIGDLLNTGLWLVWQELENNGLELLGQVHDSIIFQCDEKNVDAIVARVLELMQVPVEVHGRTMIVPVEAKVGKDWRDMEKWKNV